MSESGPDRPVRPPRIPPLNPTAASAIRPHEVQRLRAPFSIQPQSNTTTARTRQRNLRDRACAIRWYRAAPRRGNLPANQKWPLTSHRSRSNAPNRSAKRLSSVRRWQQTSGTTYRDRSVQRIEPDPQRHHPLPEAVRGRTSRRPTRRNIKHNCECGSRLSGPQFRRPLKPRGLRLNCTSGLVKTRCASSKCQISGWIRGVDHTRRLPHLALLGTGAQRCARGQRAGSTMDCGDLSPGDDSHLPREKGYGRKDQGQSQTRLKGRVGQSKTKRRQKLRRSTADSGPYSCPLPFDPPTNSPDLRFFARWDLTQAQRSRAGRTSSVPLVPMSRGASIGYARGYQADLGATHCHQQQSPTFQPSTSVHA